MKKILISACLLGLPCRYDGKAISYPAVEELRKRYDLIPFCPEMEGGLPTPRKKSEIRYGRAINEEKEDVTKYFELGAQKALKACKFFGIDVAILKENSPSCGVHQIHNGRFDGKLVAGMGFTTRLLKENGIEVYSDEEILDFLAKEKEEEEKRLALKKEREERKKAAAMKKEAEEKEALAKRGSRRPFFQKGSERKERFSHQERRSFSKGGRNFSKDGKTRRFGKKKEE